MIANSGIKMVVWARFFLTSILMFFISQSGLSQDIIYDRNSNLEGNINSPQNSRQSFFPPTQVPLEEYTSPIVIQKNNPSELNLFDLTATIVDEETDNQTEIVTENSAEISKIKDDDDASQSILKEQLIDSDVLNNNMTFERDNIPSKDNTSDIDKLISELFPTEVVESETKTNMQIDESSLQPKLTSSADEQNQQNSNLVTPSVNVDLRELSGVGLVTTGISDWQQREMPFNILLWNGSKPENIEYLYQVSEPYGSSKTINSLVYSSIIRKSAPPSGVTGNSALSQSLVFARLEWLARAGKSEALADLIRKLPEDDKGWENWQRWLGAYDLLSYNDSPTCTKADKKVSQEIDTFWLKVQILCRVIDGAHEEALFLAELMSASGEEDPLFFSLLQNFQSSQSINNILTQPSLTPLHLILMDLAQAPIEWHQISELPLSMMQASNLIKNTTREARLAFAMKQILQQSDTAYEASALIRSLYDPERQMETDFSILQNTKGDLRLIASAEIYAALAGNMFQAEIQRDYDFLFLASFKEEVEFGNGKALLPFYAELARTRLSADSLPIIPIELKTQFEQIILLDDLQNMSIQNMLDSSEDINPLLLMFNIDKAEKSSLDVLQELGLWQLLPVFDQASMIKVPIDWLESASMKTAKPTAHESLELEPTLKNALLSSSGGQRTAETILIISSLFQKHKLNHISANDLALVVKSLNEIGFSEAAEDLVKEIVTSHLLEIFWEQEA